MVFTIPTFNKGHLLWLIQYTISFNHKDISNSSCREIEQLKVVLFHKMAEQLAVITGPFQVPYDSFAIFAVDDGTPDSLLHVFT